MIELVPTNPEHAELWQSWRAEENTLKYNPIAVTSLEELRRSMSRMSSDLSDLNPKMEYQFFIKYDGELVGTVSLRNVSHMMRYAEIGYDLG